MITSGQITQSCEYNKVQFDASLDYRGLAYDVTET